MSAWTHMGHCAVGTGRRCHARRMTDTTPDRPRDRPCRAPAAHRGGRGLGRHRAEHLEPYGGTSPRSLRRHRTPWPTRAPAKYVVITAVTPTPLGEGKTTTSIGLAQGLSSARAPVDALAAAAIARADVRHQGRRGGRRLQPGRADGGREPAPDRRLPRGHLGAQPAHSHGRQPPAPRQRARHRRRGPSPGGGCWTSTTGPCATSSSGSASGWTACPGRRGSTSPPRAR